jgi:hypothetical protein
MNRPRGQGHELLAVRRKKRLPRCIRGNMAQRLLVLRSCKAFGHRTGDRECPLAQAGNLVLDAERQAREDPMSSFVSKKVVKQSMKEARRRQLERLMTEIRKEKKAKKKKHKDKKRKKEQSDTD